VAVTTAPLFSLAASGSIGKAIVYSDWKGVPYARRHVIPSNPKTPKQVSIRKTFQWVHDFYKFMDPQAQEAWVAYTKGIAMTPGNAFTQANVPVLNGAIDNTAMIFSKPVNSGPPCPTITATPGSGSFTVTLGTPVMPTGWTITHAIATCAEKMAPSGEHETPTGVTGIATTSPYTISLTGLKHAVAYVVGGWFKVLRADGIVAFGGSLNTTGTTT
jgi:hypothetical protein